MTLNKEITTRMRAIAIFSVICAHSAYNSSLASTYLDYANRLLKIFGYGGVSVFFFLAGYGLGFNKDTFQVFIKKKMVSLILPWLITGTVVYLYVRLRKGGISLSDWLLWISGSGTYLWYMTVLLILFIVFFFIKGNKICLAIVPAISLIVYFFNGRLYPHLYVWGGDYLNFIQWAIFFWLGYIIQMNNHIEKQFLLITTRYRTPIIMACVVLLIAFTALHINLNYHTVMYIPYAIVFIIFTTAFVMRSENKLLTTLGRYSFPIYLLHMVALGITNVLTEQFLRLNVFTLLLRPFLVLVITFFLVLLFEKCSEHFGEIGSILRKCIGLR